jgi:yecA family protein
MSQAFPSFSEVSQALQTLNAVGDAAEVHGLLCAVLSGRLAIRREAWVDSLMSKHLPSGDAATAAAQKTLNQLFDSSKAMLEEGQYEVKLLLPEDEAEFTERLEALVQWCQGFLSGLNRMGLGEGKLLGESADAVEDLNKIACLDVNQEAADEEAENAFEELSEYVRMAVAMLYQELHNRYLPPKQTVIH